MSRENLLIINVDKGFKESVFNHVMDLYSAYKKLGKPSKDHELIVVKHDDKTMFTIPDLYALGEIQEGVEFRVVNGVTPFFREEEPEFNYEG
tara:strand:- start:1057 stop:1332 length:276 start_codon:yes stop_codon:yes gene_type:complete